MKEMLEAINDYQKKLFNESDDEFSKLNMINTQLATVIEHSDEKISFIKARLQEYFDLAFKYKMIEGFNICKDFITNYENNASTESSDVASSQEE